MKADDSGFHQPFGKAAPSDEQPLLRPALRVLSGDRAGQFRFAAGEQGDGRVLARYAAVPSLADPRVLVPLDATSAGQRAVFRQHAAGAADPLARMAARALGAASRLGLTGQLLRHRVSLLAGEDGPAEAPVHAFLADVLRRKDIVLSFRLAPGRPNGKPVVQVLAADGTVLAYAKFGWEALTRRLIRHEANVLEELAPCTRGLPLRVPGVIYRGEWCGLEALVLSPLAGSGRTPRSPASVPIGTSVALAATKVRTVARLGDSRYWERMAAQLAEVAPALGDHARQVARHACEVVERRWRHAEIVFGQTHGDWIPPNMSVGRDGTFNVWDWERSQDDAPLGIDAAQFILFLALRRTPADRQLIARVRIHAEQALARHGLESAHAELMITLSLLGSLLWFGEARAAGRGEPEDSRFVRALETVLERGSPVTARRDPARSWPWRAASVIKPRGQSS